jgi:hypothetical protein
MTVPSGVPSLLQRSSDSSLLLGKNALAPTRVKKVSLGRVVRSCVLLAFAKKIPKSPLTGAS